MYLLTALWSLLSSGSGNPLEIKLDNIIYHIINLVILVAALWWLLHKPVKRYMDKRSKELEDMVEENKRFKQESETVRAESARQLEEEKAAFARRAEESASASRRHADEIVQRAEARAKELMEKAEREASLERTRALEDVRKQVCVISAEVAKKLVGREITAEDDERLIDDCLQEWSEE